MTTTEQQELDRMMAEVAEQQELAIEAQHMAEAQQAISEIQGRRRERQKAADIALLADVRAQLQERQSFYDKNLPVYRQQAEDYANGRSHLITARQAVDDSERNQPAVAVFLPEDPEVRRWRKHHDQLEQRLAQMQSEFNSLPNPETLRLALVYAGEQISQLTYSQANLTRKLSGETATWMDGGVSNVGSGSALPGSGKAWVR